jgi:hypothetical protein
MVEASTFGSEFIAAKTAVEMVKGLCYELRMMGYPLAGQTSVLFDNQSLVTKLYTLCDSHVRSKENYANMLTKCLDGVKLRHQRGRVLKKPPKWSPKWIATQDGSCSH